MTLEHTLPRGCQARRLSKQRLHCETTSNVAKTGLAQAPRTQRFKVHKHAAFPSFVHTQTLANACGRKDTISQTRPYPQTPSTGTLRTFGKSLPHLSLFLAPTRFRRALPGLGLTGARPSWPWWPCPAGPSAANPAQRVHPGSSGCSSRQGGWRKGKTAL